MIQEYRHAELDHLEEFDPGGPITRTEMAKPNNIEHCIIIHRKDVKSVHDRDMTLAHLLRTAVNSSRGPNRKRHYHSRTAGHEHSVLPNINLITCTCSGNQEFVIQQHYVLDVYPPRFSRAMQTMTL